MAKYCGHCGKELDEKDKYCPSCGFDIENKTLPTYSNNNNSKPINIFAILGFIISLVSGYSAIGLILSIVGLSNSKKMDGSGKGLATAGIILSILWFACIIIGIIGLLTTDWSSFG